MFHIRFLVKVILSVPLL